MNRAWRHLAGYLGILALVFAQLAVSAYACPMTPIGAMDAVSAVAAQAPCDDVDHAAANLCDKHCHDAERSQAAGAGINWAFVAGYVAVLHLPFVRASSPSGENPALRHATFPPATIRNCCFRI